MNINVFLNKSDADAVAERLEAAHVETTWAKLSEMSNDPMMVDMYMQLHQQNPDDAIFVVGDSLKAYRDYEGSKLSDLEGFHSVTDILHENWGSRGKPEHLDKVKQELGISDPQLKAAAKWWDNGPGKIYKLLDILSKF